MRMRVESHLKKLRLWLLLPPPTFHQPHGFQILVARTILLLIFTNLAIHNEYQGKDHVVVGNGAGLNIAHTGSTKFTCGSSTFALKNILLCPSIAANLLSIYQFTWIITVTLFFYFDCFYVKNVKTGKTFF